LVGLFWDPAQPYYIGIRNRLHKEVLPVAASQGKDVEIVIPLEDVGGISAFQTYGVLSGEPYEQFEEAMITPTPTPAPTLTPTPTLSPTPLGRVPATPAWTPTTTVGLETVGKAKSQPSWWRWLVLLGIFGAGIGVGWYLQRREG